MIRTFVSEVKVQINNTLECLKLYVHSLKMGGVISASIVKNGKYISLGKRIYIKKGCRIECFEGFGNQNFTPSFIIGDRVNIQYNFTALVTAKVEIGCDTIIASNVSLISENHGMDPMSSLHYHAQPLKTYNIIIGKGCWIGQNTTILPNVCIGDKTIIGANSLVNHSIPSYSIAVGNPCRIIKRYNFDSNQWEKTDKNGYFLNT